MRRKIPSTSALMAFEAAARHGSFARAAGELALTEGAISRQIARLEDFLACKLFDRAGNRVSLSSNGARYALQVREILERLDRDSQYLRGLPSSSASLEIAVIPALLTGKDINVLLNTLPRIHRRQNPDAWENYAHETGIVLENPSAGVRYDLHTMSIASALAGLGVALVPRIYIEAEIHEGKLVAPWPEAKTVTKNFCLVLPGTAAQNEGALTAFREWLLEEARN